MVEQVGSFRGKDSNPLPHMHTPKDNNRPLNGQLRACESILWGNFLSFKFTIEVAQRVFLFVCFVVYVKEAQGINLQILKLDGSGKSTLYFKSIQITAAVGKKIVQIIIKAKNLTQRIYLLGYNVEYSFYSQGHVCKYKNTSDSD